MDDGIGGAGTNKDSGDEDESIEGGDTNNDGGGDDGVNNDGDYGDNDDGDVVNGSNKDIDVGLYDVNAAYGWHKVDLGSVYSGGDSNDGSGVDDVVGVDTIGGNDANCGEVDSKVMI